MNGIGSSKTINNTAQLAAQYNDFYLQITSPNISQIGNYKIIKEIGEGSFGKAYLATHVLLNINVVLKCGLIDDPNIVREIYYHKQLKHKNIVIIKTENHLWIALEYCQGGELYYYIYEKKRLELEECRNLFFQIVLGVKYVHSLNLSHRDLKLENILLADKKRTVVKLTDFGFIREFNPQSRKFLSTICGTTVYMAPELLTSQKYSGFAIDIWSMGVILYTMLNGMLPFDDDNEMKVRERIITGDPLFFDHVPMEVNQLISKMLHKDPNQRPSLNEILNSSFLIDNYNKYLEKNTRRSSSGGDTESILSINQHYNSIDQPFESRIERELLRKLDRVDFDTEELKATMCNNEINSLTAFYELLLTQEFSKKKQKYIRERKRKLYEAKSSLRKSRKKVKSALSYADQTLAGSQPLERIMSTLSLTSAKNASRTTPNVSRKSTDRNDFNGNPPVTQSPKSSQTSRLNMEVPSPRTNTTTTLGLAQRSRRSSRDLSTTGSASNIDTSGALPRTVSFVPDERRYSLVLPDNTSKESTKKSNKSGKILNKLQFWKKNKGDETHEDTISHYSTKSNHSKSTNEKMMDSDDEKPLQINMSQNESPEKLQEQRPTTMRQQALLQQQQQNLQNQQLQQQQSQSLQSQNQQSQSSYLDLRRVSDPQQSQTTLEMPNTPPSGDGTRYGRTRPSSMISQISQLSKLSQMSTMLSESELDILDETDMDDEDYDDDVYESSINTSQDNRLQGPSASASSRPSNKKRPSYRRILASDSSVVTTSSLNGSGIVSSAPKRKASLSRLRSNSSEDISEDSYRFNNTMTSDDNVPIGRPVSPDLVKRRNFRASTTMPIINGSSSSFPDTNNGNDVSKMGYYRAPSPPIGFKFGNKPGKKTQTTAITPPANNNGTSNTNGHYLPKNYQDTKQVEDWIQTGNSSNAFSKSTIYQPVINEEEEGEENI
ncbi:ppk16 Serine/threonine-protein kinase ppk16 [Candida maltosa Xu316]